MKMWTTKEGEKIPVQKMDDQHLINSIKMMERNFHKRKSVMLEGAYEMEGMLRGELALEAIGREIEELEDADEPGDFWPIYYDLVEEANKRGLEIEK